MSFFKLIWLVIFAVILDGCIQNRTNTWTVLTPGVPVKVSPQFSYSLLTAYILKQTHEPLFRRGSNLGYYSKILDHWSRSLDSRKFVFCISRPKTFYKQNKFGPSELESFLEKEYRALGFHQYKITRQGPCVKSVFSAPNRELLRRLTNRSTAPSLPSSNAKFEWGLGPFFVASITSKKVILLRKNFVADGYNKIVYYDVNYLTNNELETRRMDDYNLIPSALIPEFVKKGYIKLDAHALKISAVIFNIQNVATRKAIYDCFPIRKFRKALFDTKKFKDIASMLPLGVPGAVPGIMRRQKCLQQTPTTRHQKAIKFLLWQNKRQREIRRIIGELSRKVGIPIDVEFDTFNKLNAVIYKNPSSYNLLAIKIDSKQNEFAPFFGAFADPHKSILSVTIPGAYSLFLKLEKAKTETEKINVSQKLQNLFLNRFYILPLFQDDRTIYYPKGLKHLEVGDDYLGFPDVSLIER